MWFATHATILLAASLTATYARDDCSLSTSMDGIPAQRFAYALQNISCPVNLGYLALLDYDNTSAVLPYSADIVTTIKQTTPYLTATGNITSSAQTDLWRGPINDIPDGFSKWIGQLLAHKDALSKMADAVAAGLTQQRDAAKGFFALVVSKVDQEQKGDVSGMLNPVLDELDCAIGAFKSGSKVTACPATATSSAGGSKATTTASGSSSSGSETTTAPAAASSTGHDSGVATTAYSLVRVLTGVLFACVAVPFL